MRTTRWAACGVALLFGACGVSGSGTPKSEGRELGAFSSVSLSGALAMDITSSAPAHSVVISGDDNLVPMVTSEVKDGMLVLGLPGSVSPDLPLQATITMPSIEKLTVSGATKGIVRGVGGEKLDIDVSGAAELALSGTTRAFTLGVSGVGKVTAQDLVAETVAVNLSGAADVTVHASASLTATVSGAGRIRYAGNPPEVKPSVSGAGSIEKLVP